jgi:hypothetical protein
MPRKHELETGQRVVAPHPKYNDEPRTGVVQDNLSVMYFIKFDDGSEDFVYKAGPIRPETNN